MLGGRHADNCSRRRRPQYPDLGIDRTRSRRLSNHHLHRRRLSEMPRMDGMETLRRLRQKSDLPVIFLTSKEEEIDELFGLKMGADDFIRKPFSQRLLT